MKSLANLFIVILIVSLCGCSIQKTNTYSLSSSNNDFMVLLNNQEINQQSKIKLRGKNIMTVKFQKGQICCDNIEVILAKGPHPKLAKVYHTDISKNQISFDATPFLNDIETGDRLVFTSDNEKPVHFEIGIN